MTSTGIVIVSCTAIISLSVMFTVIGSIAIWAGLKYGDKYSKKEK